MTFMATTICCRCTDTIERAGPERILTSLEETHLGDCICMCSSLLSRAVRVPDSLQIHGWARQKFATNMRTLDITQLEMQNCEGVWLGSVCTTQVHDQGVLVDASMAYLQTAIHAAMERLPLQ
jgi:hypothetical protein